MNFKAIAKGYVTLKGEKNNQETNQKPKENKQDKKDKDTQKN